MLVETVRPSLLYSCGTAFNGQ